jgi:hypothetical protein
MVIASFEIFGPSKFNVRNGSYNLKRDTLGFHIIPVYTKYAKMND